MNPDLIEYAVEEYRLWDLFDCVVSSWDSATDDKAALCCIALEQMGGTDPPAAALLIDNIDDNVARWKSLGGLGYLFTDDATFVADVRRGLVRDFGPADLI